MIASKLKNRSVSRRNKLANLKKHDVLKGDPQDIVHMDWSAVLVTKFDKPPAPVLL